MALHHKTRSISFRNICSRDILQNYNIVVWEGKSSLHEGLLEYLRSRENNLSANF
jgi:hypothetical protein